MALSEEATCCSGMGVCLCVCLHVCVYPLLWLLGMRRCPTQHLSSCRLQQIHTQLLVKKKKKINKVIMLLRPSDFHSLWGLLLCVCDGHSPAGQCTSKEHLNCAHKQSEVLKQPHATNKILSLCLLSFLSTYLPLNLLILQIQCLKITSCSVQVAKKNTSHELSVSGK